jgi:hypothetical protein
VSSAPVLRLLQHALSLPNPLYSPVCSGPVISSLQHALSLLSLLCLHRVLCSRAQFTTARTESSQSAVSSPCPLLPCSVQYSTYCVFSVRCVFTVSSAPVLSSIQHVLSLLSLLCFNMSSAPVLTSIQHVLCLFSPLCLHRVLGFRAQFTTASTESSQSAVSSPRPLLPCSVHSSTH